MHAYSTQSGRALAVMLAALALIGLVGCGPSHKAVRMMEVGQPLHLTVSVPDEDAPGASGTVYYSIGQVSAGYESRPLALQGTNLMATLSTQGLGPGERVAYYFDVQTGGESTSLGSAQKPYVTEFLLRDELIQRSIDCKVSHGKAGSPVTFSVDAVGLSGSRIERAVVWYSPPDLPGLVEQPMLRSGHRWITQVPGNRVAAGAWTYRIEVEVEGKTYNHPIAGNGAMSSFTVKAEKSQDK